MESHFTFYCFDFQPRYQPEIVYEFHVNKAGSIYTLSYGEWEKTKYTKGPFPLPDFGPVADLKKTILKIFQELRKIELVYGTYPALKTKSRPSVYERHAERLARHIQQFESTSIEVYGTTKKYPGMDVGAHQKQLDGLIKQYGEQPPYDGYNRINFEELMQDEINAQ
jgi:hypothetical protein